MASLPNRGSPIDFLRISEFHSIGFNWISLDFHWIFFGSFSISLGSFALITKNKKTFCNLKQSLFWMPFSLSPKLFQWFRCLVENREKASSYNLYRTIARSVYQFEYVDYHAPITYHRAFHRLLHTANLA